MPAKRMLIAAAFFGLALFMAVSFVSYDGVHSAADRSPLANMGGEVGVALSDALLHYFGAGSFAIAFFSLFMGFSVLTRRPIRSPLAKSLGAVLCTLLLATIVQSIDPDGGYARSSYLLGGIAGDMISSSLLVWFGGLGTVLILALMTVCALVLATDTLFIEMAQAAPQTTREAWASLRRLRRPRLALAGGADEEVLGDEEEEEPSSPRKRKSRAKKAVAESEEDELSEEFEEDLEDGEEQDVLAFDDLSDGLDLDGLDELLAADPIEAPTKSKRSRRKKKDRVDFGAMDIDPADVPVEIEDLDPDIAEFEDLEEDWEEEEEAEEVEVSSGPVREPIIRRGGIQLAGDGIEILKIWRAEHLLGHEPYELPPLSLLEEMDERDNSERDAEIKRKARKLEETLATFGIQGEVVEISRGPTITVYEIELAAGTKVKRITSLPDDISMALKAKTIRIVAPIPGKSTVGIEVPNDRREKVRLRELALSEALHKKHYKIPLFLGKNAAGDALIEDLTSMPHLLIAGQTGSGKSVCINSIIASLLLTKYPEEVRLILIDPKMVELQAFRDVPHLLTPVVTDMKKAPKVLDWAVSEMDQRYESLSACGVRDIARFNALGPEEVRKRLSEHFTEDEIDKQATSLPYVVVIVDELADLMMTSAKEVESSICRLAQKSRAVGIHVILATQRPSVDVITGLIKSNMPSRISFRVASKIDSRTILDQMGAERLLGQGDMLLMAPRSSGPVRCQAVLVEDSEIKQLVSYVKDVAQTEYSRELTQVPSAGDMTAQSFEERDPLYEDAVRSVLSSQRGSVSMLQRKLEIGYTRAARLVDFMAEDGIVGSFKGSKAREVLLTLEDWEAQRSQEA